MATFSSRLKTAVVLVHLHLAGHRGEAAIVSPDHQLHAGGEEALANVQTAVGRGAGVQPKKTGAVGGHGRGDAGDHLVIAITLIFIFTPVEHSHQKGARVGGVEAGHSGGRLDEVVFSEDGYCLAQLTGRHSPNARSDSGRPRMVASRIPPGDLVELKREI
ncbi:hypothetical protein TYRP_009121 [Tyrophagus putrescentiae]|nr:hypothetical protein TYRP_009121 [Tyrophagus putrescentiae]